MEIISPNKEGIDIIVKKILKGDIVVVPTDTVYGIAVHPYKNKGIKEIFLLKKRPLNKPMMLLCSSLEMAKKYVIFNKIALKLVKNFWPGPLSLILEKKKKLKIAKKWISKNNSIGIRVPNNKIIRKIIKKCNFPIFCTSANLSDKKSYNNIKDIIKNFNLKEISVVNGGKTKFKNESTIIDVRDNKLNILREGYLNKKEIKKIWK
tara:strand:- start:9638 stop:10255 length:618 start_codon:yes stop_codon:yes gene_type:complete